MCGCGVKISVYDDADYAAASNDQRSASDVAAMLGETANGLEEFYAKLRDECHV